MLGAGVVIHPTSTNSIASGRNQLACHVTSKCGQSYSLSSQRSLLCPQVCWPGRGHPIWTTSSMADPGGMGTMVSDTKCCPADGVTRFDSFLKPHSWKDAGSFAIPNQPYGLETTDPISPKVFSELGLLMCPLWPWSLHTKYQQSKFPQFQSEKSALIPFSHADSSLYVIIWIYQKIL